MQKTVTVKNVQFSNKLPFVLIAGPCQMESKEHAFMMCGQLVEITKKLGIPLIYKTSFDKANRTSLKGKRGLGLEKAGLIISGISPDGKLPEIVERKDHPWFVAVQFHPELKSRPFAPHPLFVSFVKAAMGKGKVARPRRVA